MSSQSELLRGALEREFATRKKNNGRYSLRAYARYLGVDASTLSKVVNGSRSPSDEFIHTIVKRLDLPITSIKPKTDKDIVYLSDREFQAISSWEHFAILDLATLSNFQSDASWISSKIGIKEVDVRLATERLLALGLLVLQNNVLKVTGRTFSNHPDCNTNEVKKEYQRQLLRKALEAVDNCKSSEKDITSITIAGDPKRIELAREMIKTFRRELCAFLESGEKTEVFHLTIQLCPMKTDSKGNL